MRSIGVRNAAACGAIVLLAVAALTSVTGSTTVRDVQGSVTLVADRDFDLEVAGVNAPEFGADPQWSQGRPEAVDVALADRDAGFAPGDRYVFTIGARNSSADLGGDFRLSLVDRRPNQATLFDILEYTVRIDGEVIVEGVPGSDIAALTALPLGPLAARESRDVVIEVLFPSTAGNEAQGRGAWVQVRIDGENL